MADVAAGLALVAAAYEAVAVWFRKVPTITDVVVARPRLLRVGLIAVFLLWAVSHFEVV